MKKREQKIREIIRTLCQWKGINIIEGEICPDHVPPITKYIAKNEYIGIYGIFKK